MRTKMHIFFVLSQVYQCDLMNPKQRLATNRKARRPERLVRAVLFVLLFTILGGLGFWFWEALTAQLQNPLSLTFAFLVLASILFIFLDRSMRIIAQTYFNNLVRTITSGFVTIDPIEVLENYIVELKDNTAKMNRQMHRLRSQMHVLEEEIVNNRKEIEELMSRAQTARDAGDDADFTLQVRKTGRLEESTEKLSRLLKRMKSVYAGLSSMKKHSRNLSEDLADELELKRKERDAIRTSHSAMEAAMELLDDKGEATSEFDEALEDIADDVSRKVGEMEHYMKLSDEFLKTVDLQKGVLEDEGMKKLEKWQSQLDKSSSLELKQPLGKSREKDLAETRPKNDEYSKE